MSGSPESLDVRLLRALAGGGAVTQRVLSRELGVALGLTNLLIKRLVGKGYVKVSRLRPRHVRYLLTAEGQRALASAARQSLQNTVSLYTETRDLIRTGLDGVAAAHPGAPVVFYGLGDVAEIAFVGLQSTNLDLIGVVDDFRTGQFFGRVIQSPDTLVRLGTASDVNVIVTTIRRSDEIGARLRALGVAPERVFFLDSAIAAIPTEAHVR